MFEQCPKYALEYAQIKQKTIKKHLLLRRKHQKDLNDICYCPCTFDADFKHCFAVVFIIKN